MSRIVNKKSSATLSSTAPVEDVSPEETSTLSFAESHTSSEHVARVVFEANATADQLARGHTVRLASAKQVFHTENKDADYSKGIITGINACSVYSDCSEPITMSLNLFNTSEQQPSVQNETGWLHAPAHSDLGAVSAVGSRGFKNLMNILPYERTRCSVVAYKPEDVANDRYIQQYGSYNTENLWDGVVSFPGESYYLVSTDHVVLSVIANNWEQLGLNVDDEHRFNGKYVQVPTHVFDRVVKDLEAQVLSRMPFTNLGDIRAQFTTKQALSYNNPHEEGSNGKYKVMVELSFNYQFPNANQNVAEEP